MTSLPVALREIAGIERLEPRIAPAAVFDSATSAHFTDADGDLVKISFSKPILTAANIGNVIATTGSGLGEFLQAIDLEALANPQDAKGINITLAAKRTAAGGDGFASVGTIKATNIDLGTIVIPGDLGKITAGDGDTATAGVKSLSAQSMGVLFSTGMVNESDITGSVGSLKIAGDFQRAYLVVTGNIGSAKIGGSLHHDLSFLQEGTIYATGRIGAVSIGHDIGSKIAGSGTLKAGAGISSVVVGGSVFAGLILGAGGVGTLSVAGEISLSARVQSNAAFGAVSVGGSVFGSIISAGDMGPVIIKGDVRGDDISPSGYVHSGGAIKSVAIGGSILGPTLTATTNQNVHDSGAVSATGAIGSVKVGGDIVGGRNFTVGGSLTDSGVILAKRIASLIVGGSIISGQYTLASSLTRSGAIVADDDIGTIAVKGGLLGTPSYVSPRVPVLIIARGSATPAAGADVAIKSITVGGSVVDANILAGYSKQQLGLNADARIGSIKVSGDWVGSYAIAGIDPANGRVGDGDEHKLIGDYGAGMAKDDGATLASIGSIVINGLVLGDRGLNNLYGFGAEVIGSFKNGSTVFPLHAGAHNDQFGGTPATGVALAIGASRSNLTADGFAIHVFEV